VCVSVCWLFVGNNVAIVVVVVVVAIAALPLTTCCWRISSGIMIILWQIILFTMPHTPSPSPSLSLSLAGGAGEEYGAGGAGVCGLCCCVGDVGVPQNLHKML